jgi:glycerol uptake facilitator-like aquaporin
MAGGTPRLPLLANTLATVAVIAALISSLGPISGAHFNPVVTIAAIGLRRLDPALVRHT